MEREKTHFENLDGKIIYFLYIGRKWISSGLKIGVFFLGARRTLGGECLVVRHQKDKIHNAFKLLL